MDIWNGAIHENLKGVLRNQRCPEGCSVELYIVEEAVKFCTKDL